MKGYTSQYVPRYIHSYSVCAWSLFCGARAAVAVGMFNVYHNGA